MLDYTVVCQAINTALKQVPFFKIQLVSLSCPCSTYTQYGKHIQSSVRVAEAVVMVQTGLPLHQNGFKGENNWLDWLASICDVKFFWHTTQSVKFLFYWF